MGKICKVYNQNKLYSGTKGGFSSLDRNRFQLLMVYLKTTLKEFLQKLRN